MKQTKKPFYNIEFKKDAVQLILSNGYSIAEAAQNLGVSESALRRWVNAEKGGNTEKSSNILTLSEHEELLRLRKEITKLKMEREILKKAAAFFAQELP